MRNVEFLLKRESFPSDTFEEWNKYITFAA